MHSVRPISLSITFICSYGGFYAQWLSVKVFVISCISLPSRLSRIGGLQCANSGRWVRRLLNLNCGYYIDFCVCISIFALCWSTCILQLAKDRGGSSGASVARFQAFASVKSLYNSASQKSFITSEQRVKKTQRAQLLKYIREDLSNDEIDGFQSIGDKVCPHALGILLRSSETSWGSNLWLCVPGGCDSREFWKDWGSACIHSECSMAQPWWPSDFWEPKKCESSNVSGVAGAASMNLCNLASGIREPWSRYP